eukprot:3646970-Pleurochrysis_carterae.AAC.1
MRTLNPSAAIHVRVATHARKWPRTHPHAYAHALVDELARGYAHAHKSERALTHVHTRLRRAVLLAGRLALLPRNEVLDQPPFPSACVSAAV